MTNRKNAATAKSATKSALKSEHKHNDLEKQILELKKELRQAIVTIDRLGKESRAMSVKIKDLELVDSDKHGNDDKINFVITKIAECSDYTMLRKFFKHNR